MKKAKRKATIGGSVRKSGTDKWQCDFCLDAVEFTSYEAALEHGQSCPSKSLVEIPYKPDKKLGLIPINAIETRPRKKYYVTLSKSSPVFKLANNTRAASKALFGLDPWEMKNDTEAIECMVAFGRANLPEINKVNCKGASAPVDAGAINSEVMKSALIGQLRPGDRIKCIDYKEGSNCIKRITQSMENKPEGAQDLCYMLKHER